MCTSAKKVGASPEEVAQANRGRQFRAQAKILNDVPEDLRRFSTIDETRKEQGLVAADRAQTVASGGGYGAQQYVAGGNRVSGPSATAQAYQSSLADIRQDQGQKIFEGNLAAANYGLGGTAQAGISAGDTARMRTQNLIAEQGRKRAAAQGTFDLALGLGAIGVSGYKSYKADKLAASRHKDNLKALGGGGTSGGLGGYNVSGGSSTTPQFGDLGSDRFWSGF